MSEHFLDVLCRLEWLSAALVVLYRIPWLSADSALLRNQLVKTPETFAQAAKPNATVSALFINGLMSL